MNVTLARRYRGRMSARVPSERDAHLLTRIQAGDDRALSAIYDEHIGVVYGVARRVTRDEQLARDVCQEVFAYLWQLPHRVDLTKGSLRAYLAVVAHRRAVDEVRRSERRSRAEAVLHVPQQSDGPELEVVDSAAATWRDQKLCALVDALPEEQRTALRLAYFDGLTYRQVAAALGIAEGTAKSRLRLALARLRTLLDAEFRAAI
jgi:RNA polymerase sigma factor (sigma-70 family)